MVDLLVLVSCLAEPVVARLFVCDMAYVMLVYPKGPKYLYGRM